MDKNKNINKQKGSKFVSLIVSLLLLIVIIIFINHGGLEYPQGIFVFIIAVILDLIGFINFLKPNKDDGRSNISHQQILQSSDISTNLGESKIENIKSMVSKSSTNDVKDNTLGNSDQARTVNKTRMIPAILVFVVLFAVIVIKFAPSIFESDTTITGTWDLEIGSTDLQDEWTFVMNLTNWNVDTRTDTGIIYMYVNQDGTFTVEYNNNVVCYGTWTQADDGSYKFLEHDPDGILASSYSDFDIKGTKLYSYNDFIFTKE